MKETIAYPKALPKSMASLPNAANGPQGPRKLSARATHIPPPWPTYQRGHAGGPTACSRTPRDATERAVAGQGLGLGLPGSH